MRPEGPGLSSDQDQAATLDLLQGFWDQAIDLGMRSLFGSSAVNVIKGPATWSCCDARGNVAVMTAPSAAAAQLGGCPPSPGPSPRVAGTALTLREGRERRRGTGAPQAGRALWSMW
ncbi:unnamed protein product [Pleuronectes platessa]|uniref:Uncharacterized protein n=1 Tax=Pleuronectes platessa TaxID=8262 RepID=A0A9N7Z8G7_PLEPL|nr:unnamed protein product [Pleuronectes platessa]